MNPIINQLMGTAFNNNPIMAMYRAVMNARDPNAMMQSLAQQNPQLQQTLDFIKQNGGDAKQLFYNMAQQKNVAPNTVFSQLK